MTSPTLVWAFRPLVELNGITGYVDAGSLAEGLLAAGAVQPVTPWEQFKPVESGPMVPGLPQKKPRAGPGEREEDNDDDGDASRAAQAAAHAARAKPRGKVSK